MAEGGFPAAIRKPPSSAPADPGAAGSTGRRGGRTMVRKSRLTGTERVRQAEADVREIRKHSRELLSHANKTVREYRKELSTLKKAGLVAKRIHVKEHKPTRYMLGKIRKFHDVATGQAVAVKATEEVRQKYREKGMFAERGDYLIIPKTDEKMRADIVKGHVATYRPLTYGQERIIYLPFQPSDLNRFADMLDDKESEINRLKERNEQFGFQLWGHNSRIGFADAAEMREYILGRYKHLLSSPKWSREALREFVLLRFKHNKGAPQSEPMTGSPKVVHKRYKDRRKDDPKYYWENQKRRDKEAKKKADKRARETDEQRKARLEKQRQYDKDKSNYRRELRMAKKLLGE